MSDIFIYTLRLFCADLRVKSVDSRQIWDLWQFDILMRFCTCQVITIRTLFNTTNTKSITYVYNKSL